MKCSEKTLRHGSVTERMNYAVSLMSPLAKKISRSAGYKHGIIADDIYQEAFLDMFEAIRRNPEGEFTSSYLTFSIRGAIRREIAFSKGRKTISMTLSGSDGEEFDIPEDKGYEIDILAHKNAVKSMNLATPEQLDMLICMYAKDMTASEYARKVGKTRAAISKSHSIIINKIREKLSIDISA